MLSMPTLKRRCTREEAVPTVMDRLPLSPRRAGANTTLVRGMCLSTKRGHKLTSVAVEMIGRLGVEGN